MVKLSEAVGQSYSLKKGFLKIPQNSQENTCVRVSLLIKLKALGRRNLAKFLKTPFLTEHLRWLLLSYVKDYPSMAFKVFNRELLVTDNARSISKHMLFLKVFLYSLGVTLNVHE